MRDECKARAERAIKEGVFPGCVIGIVHASGERTLMPFGTLSRGSEAVQEDTVYDLASVTKSIPLATLALDLVAEGALALEQRVVDHIPELQNHFDATIEDLLRYRVVGERLSRLEHLSPERFLERVLARGFTAPPSDRSYSNLPAFLLGVLIERLLGADLATLASERYFLPLHMERTTFAPLSCAGVAPTERDASGSDVCGIPHDESARTFARAGRAVGHAGLFSTAGDLLTFLERMLIHDSVRRRMAERGLGWSVNEPFFMGGMAGERTIGKTGFTGTSVVCDRDRGLGLVILSNRTYPERPHDALSVDSAINHFRRNIADCIMEAG